MSTSNDEIMSEMKALVAALGESNKLFDKVVAVFSKVLTGCFIIIILLILSLVFAFGGKDGVAAIKDAIPFTTSMNDSAPILPFDERNNTIFIKKGSIG